MFLSNSEWGQNPINIKQTEKPSFVDYVKPLREKFRFMDELTLRLMLKHLHFLIIPKKIYSVIFYHLSEKHYVLPAPKEQGFTKGKANLKNIRLLLLRNKWSVSAEWKFQQFCHTQEKSLAKWCILHKNDIKIFMSR